MVDTVITLLAGKRPELTRDTLNNLPNCLKQQHVIALNNGTDAETDNLLHSYDFIDRIMETDKYIDQGKAMSKLAIQAINSRKFYWLMLEDDWHYKSKDCKWLAQAKRILNMPQVGQVRLRAESEKVLHYNMITKLTIRYKDYGEYKIGNGHYTNNPSLVRVRDIRYLWPSINENHAMRKYNFRKYLSAQMKPGVFYHSGDGHSLEGHSWQ